MQLSKERKSFEVLKHILTANAQNAQIARPDDYCKLTDFQIQIIKNVGFESLIVSSDSNGRWKVEYIHPHLVKAITAIEGKDYPNVVYNMFMNEYIDVVIINRFKGDLSTSKEDMLRIIQELKG